MRYGFFDANVTGYDENNMPIFDRAEDSEFFSEFFESFLSDGIYSSPANGFEVKPVAGMVVSVGVGRCLIQGRFGWADEEETLLFAAADSNRARVDRVVLRLNLTDRNITVAVRQGEYSTGGTAPALVRDLSAGIWELGIAEVTIPAAAVEILEENIKDTRGDKLLCGFVSSIGTLNAGTAAVVIAPEEWQGTAAPYEVTKAVEGVTASNNIIVTGAEGSMAAWLESGCYAANQGFGTITFKALYGIPEGAVTANVLIVG